VSWPADSCHMGPCRHLSSRYHILTEVNGGTPANPLLCRYEGNPICERIRNTLRVIGIDVPYATSKAERYIQQQAWAEVGVSLMANRCALVQPGPPDTDR